MAALLAGVALIDWLTGPFASMNGFYIVPICLAAWSLGALRGLAVGLVFAALSVMLNGFGDGFLLRATRVETPVAIWNVCMRGLWVAIITMLVASFRRSHDAQRRRARTDDLTGALNKHAFEDHLGRAINFSARRGRSLVLIYSDLDGFKAVNDLHGHAAGDHVLIEFADAIARSIRSRDVLARIGGDEFVMLLSVASGDDGFAAAERLHCDASRGLAVLPFAVTASMGAVIVERPQAGDDKLFLKMADSLMYEVKRAGKNALRVAYVDKASGSTDRLDQAA